MLQGDRQIPVLVWMAIQTKQNWIY